MIQLQNVTVSYERHPAVHHVSGTINEGQLIALVGPNGGGKSTFLKAIMGLLPLETGSIKSTIHKKDFAYLSQLPDIDRTFPITVLETVTLGHCTHRGLFKRFTDTDIADAKNALHQVEMDGFENRPLSTLSVGQLQRVLFARTIVQNARVILLDEPFAAIDQRTVAALMKLLLQWQSEGRTILCVLHDLNLAQTHFPDSILLARELIGWGATSDVLTPHNLEHARTHAESWFDPCAAHSLCLPRAV